VLMATPGTAVGGADQGSAEGEAAEPKSRRAPAPLNIEDNDAPFWPAPTSRYAISISPSMGFMTSWAWSESLLFPSLMSYGL
jgi:hypothetical protein